MTEISLLMTGVFNTRPPTPLDLSKQQAFLLTNTEDLSISEAAALITAIEATPPEFIDINITTEVDPLSILAEKREQIIEQIKQKHLTTNSLNLASSQEIPTDRPKAKLLAAYQKYYGQPMPILRFGSSGVPVRVLQQLLVSYGYGIKVDGVFGPITETAVKAFQSQRELLIDGIVGQRTWWELTI